MAHQRATPTSAAPRPSQRLVLQRLLVGYDGSEGSTSAAAFAMSLAGRGDASATLLRAGPTTDMSPFDAEPMPQAAARMVAEEQAWRQRLEELCALQPAGARVDYRLDRGAPAAVVIAAALDIDADLVLMGTGGVGRLRDAVMGSVSAPVLMHAPCSVMLFPERATASVDSTRAVVVGVDGSPSSSYALLVAQALAASLGAPLVLAHVIDASVPRVTRPPEIFREQVREHGMRTLHEARDEVVAPLEAVEEELLEGRAREELVAACERHAPAVLVVGARGLGGFEGMLVGSTPRWLVNHAPCPVLVARDRAALIS